MAFNTPQKPTRVKWTGPTPEQEQYQSLSKAEDKQRTNLHYEQPPLFFNRITGGEWNTYSCNVWEDAGTETESQEAKLDLLARCMELKPGQRILDVGCGWGGPLVYLSRKYGVQGVGLTLSPMQKQAAEERIARYDADVTVVESHWGDYHDAQGFDAIYTDEVIVHFNDLAGFFMKAHSLLRNGGRMVNKELHFTHHEYSRMTRAMVLVNEIYGNTGNYRTLAEELTLLGQAGFEVQGVHQLARSHYTKTIDCWLSNMNRHREELLALVETECYARFHKYFKLARMMVGAHTMTLNVVVAHKVTTPQA
jgi:cyclopropane-fatty-acyl-phospholipid synthase